MSDATPAFDFSQFVPGFDFLKNLAAGAAAPGQGAGSVPGLPSLSNWVAPTLSVEEVDKRIQELKTVQYWLEQNGHALKATIQALEVQKMTLSTLRGMNVRMEDLANAFTRNANAATAAVMPSAPTPPVAPPPPAAAPAPATAPATPMTSFFNRMAEAMQPSAAEDKEEAEEAPEPAEPVGNGRATPADDRAEDARSGESQGAQGAAGATAGVIDPLQWWGALTQQFQQIAESAMKDAAQIQMPVMPQMPAAPSPAKSSKAAKSGGSTGAAKATKTATSTGTAAAAAAKKTSGASGTGASRAKASPTPAASAKSASSTAKAAPRKSAAAPTSARRSRG